VNVTRQNDPRYGQLTRAAVDAKLATTPGATKTGTNNYTYSAYVSDVFNVTDQLSAMVSLRFDYFDTKPTINYNTMVKSGKYDQRALSPKFGLVYQVVKDKVSLFANYMNGFRNVSPVPGNEQAGYPVNLKPQQADQKEGGIKLDILQHKLAFTASYYDILVTNISRGITVNGQNVTIQDGEQRSKGVEFDLIANPVPGLNIIAGYGYNDSKMVNAAPATKDRRPNAAGPSSLANFWISYAVRGGHLRGFGGGFGGNYASENIITSTLATGDFTLPSYTVFNATVFYNADKFRVAVKADNITNKEYFGGWTTVEKQMPRRFSASVAVKF
jgi:iron complex outermembrane receptor protein